MNGWDFLLIVILAAVILGALAAIRRNKKRGKSCCGDCASCGQSCRRADGPKNER